MSFQSRDSHSSPILKSNHILKFEDKVFIVKIYFGLVNQQPSATNGRQSAALR